MQEKRRRQQQDSQVEIKDKNRVCGQTTVKLSTRHRRQLTSKVKWEVDNNKQGNKRHD